MATYLYRIGRFAYRRKGVVLSVWLTLLVAFGVGAATLSGPTSESFSIPGTPAQQAQDLMAERFPGAADPMSSLSARYVFAAPEGQTLDSAANQAAMDAVLAKIRDIGQVEGSAGAQLANPVVAAEQIERRDSGCRGRGRTVPAEPRPHRGLPRRADHRWLQRRHRRTSRLARCRRAGRP